MARPWFLVPFSSERDQGSLEKRLILGLGQKYTERAWSILCQKVRKYAKHQWSLRKVESPNDTVPSRHPLWAGLLSPGVSVRTLMCADAPSQALPHPVRNPCYLERPCTGAQGDNSVELPINSQHQLPPIGGGHLGCPAQLSLQMIPPSANNQNKDHKGEPPGWAWLSRSWERVITLL